MLYLKYNQMLNINNYKYNYIYLNNLKYIIEKIYNKKVEFNIINLKYLHLDSKIFSEFISLKMKNRKNKLIKILKKALVLPKISFSKRLLLNIHSLYINRYNNLNLLQFGKNDYNLDMLHLIFYNIFNLNKIYTKNLYIKDKIIYKSIKFRKIIGVRLEAKGRLTSRLTAARSIYKLRYKGNLKNIDSLNNMSSVMMKGYLKSNIDYTNINSKTRNGCFGLKG